MNLGVHMPRHRVLDLPKPALTFRIYPEDRRRWYYQVHIFRTRPQFRKFARLYWKRPPKDIWAFTHEETGNGSCMGVVAVPLWMVTDNTIAHEIFHAVMWWSCGRLYLDPYNVCGWGDVIHERVAEAHGNMVSQFWKAFSGAGFKRSECWGFSPKEQR